MTRVLQRKGIAEMRVENMILSSLMVDTVLSVLSTLKTLIEDT